MLVKISSYLTAFVFLATVELSFAPISMSLAMLMRRVNRESRLWLSIPITFLYDTTKIIIVILFATWIIKKIGGSPSWFMFIVPGILMYRNDMLRLRWAKSGTSGVRAIFERAGEPESYSQSHDVWMERAHLGGDMFGWVIATNLFLQSAEFF